MSTTFPKSLTSSQPHMTIEDALHTVKTVGEQLEEARTRLAVLYAQAPGNTSIEHEVGECLTQVRKSLARLRKAVGELAQQELPFEEER